jgi:Tol biopolymer transport system component
LNQHGQLTAKPYTKQQKSLNVFSINVNGGKPTQHTFTKEGSGIKGMSVADDGKHIVYARVADNGDYEIVLAALNGGKMDE